MIDTHTADGLKVGLENRETGVPSIVLETCTKFEETIVEALGEKPGGRRLMRTSNRCRSA